FLLNLNLMHTRVKLMFPKLVPPRIECHEVTATSLRLHYFSHRSGLAPFVVGLVEGLGEMFATPARVEQVGVKGGGDAARHLPGAVAGGDARGLTKGGGPELHTAC
ncbi:Soluble guanylate cyclase gcy-31, partial [sediment metagenome]